MPVVPTLPPAGGTSPDLAVLTRLREGTAPQHRRVEARLFPTALRTRESYAGMLAAMLALHAPLEARLAALDARSGVFARHGLDLAGRRKADRLAADLRRLPAPAPGAPHPATPAPPLDGPADALGAFYVLEGSTLGGRALLGEVTKRLGDVPVTFLAGYGDQTGRRWQAVRRALVDVVADAADRPAAGRRLVAAARATFDHLDALLTTAGWPVPTDDRAVWAAR